MNLQERHGGIVGLGNIGRGVAKIAADFGCNVIYYSASGHSYDVPYERYELDEFFEEIGHRVNSCTA